MLYFKSILMEHIITELSDQDPVEVAVAQLSTQFRLIIYMKAIIKLLILGLLNNIYIFFNR
jgi:hypothetical protein